MKKDDLLAEVAEMAKGDVAAPSEELLGEREDDGGKVADGKGGKVKGKEGEKEVVGEDGIETGNIEYMGLEDVAERRSFLSDGNSLKTFPKFNDKGGGVAIICRKNIHIKNLIQRNV